MDKEFFTNQKYSLHRLDDNQPNFPSLVGEIIFDKVDSPNGFIEEITKQENVEKNYVYRIFFGKNGVLFTQIGRFLQERNKRDENERLAESFLIIKEQLQITK